MRLARRCRTRKRQVLAIGTAILGAGSLFATASAGAGLPIGYVVAPPMASTVGYATTSITIAHGQGLTFLNLEPVPHSVTSIETTIKLVKLGKRTYKVKSPDFDTKLVNGPSSTKVLGIEKLKPGTYHFVCTLHPSMMGTLTVT